MEFISVLHIILILLLCFYISYTDSGQAQLNHSIRDETTTAVPLLNSTKVDAAINETTPSTPTSTLANRLTERQTTPGTTPSGSFYTTKFIKYTTNDVVKASTTTAMPLGTSNTFVERQFDPLSFMGGCLFTVSIISLGVFIWRIYEAKIERSYLTI